MKLIVGLGNPGKEYEKTRHNLGFMVVDKIIEDRKLLPLRLENERKSQVTQAQDLTDDKVIFAKPQTFMNLSGEAVGNMARYYKIDTGDIWVIEDDINLSVGTVRVRFGGSDGGHNGLKNITQVLGTDKYWRIRLGIGTNLDKNIPAEAYVLQKFSKEEEKDIENMIDKVSDLVVSYISSGIKEETINKI